MTKRLILFNGPPRSGKDTAADFVWKHYDNVRKFKMSQPLKDGIKAFFNLSDAELAQLEAIKDSKHPLLFGNSYRDTQISLSEEWAKECFGLKVFGHLAVRNILRSPASLFVCSDSGFSYEAVPLVEFFGKGNTLLVRLHRTGTSFKHDSRDYVDLPGVMTLDMYNNGEVTQFHAQLQQVIDAWLEQ